MTTLSPAANQRGRAALTVVLAILGLAGTLAVIRTSLLHALALRAEWPQEADTLYLPPTGALRVLSLGHSEMAADLVAARANVYFGSQLATHGEQRWLARYLETAAALDPRFHRLYLRGAAMLVYNGKSFNVADFEAANQLLARGQREFPGDWELPFQIGFNLLFEMPKLVPRNDARVADWRQRGAEQLRAASLLDGVAPWLPNLAASMLTKEGEAQLAIHHLEQTYAVTSNPETRAEIGRKLADLRGQQTAAELAAAAEALRKLVEENYPYAPEAFSVVTGPRVPPGVDLPALLGSTGEATAPASGTP